VVVCDASEVPDSLWSSFLGEGESVCSLLAERFLAIFRDGADRSRFPSAVRWVRVFLFGVAMIQMAGLCNLSVLERFLALTLRFLNNVPEQRFRTMVVVT